MTCVLDWLESGLSEAYSVDLALDEGPQTVTRHGKGVALIVSKEDFERRRRRTDARGTIVSFLRGLAFRGVDLELERARDRDRDVQL